jgi:putative holliday junction resolvase
MMDMNAAHQTNEKRPVPGKLMALDVGEARIGVAVCDPLQLAARPLQVIHRRSRRDDYALLADLVRREEITVLICGLPLNADGTEGDQARTTRKWAMRLAQALRALGANRPLIFWDERLTTFAAQEIMAGQPGRRRPEHGEDAVAAAVILQNYLDAQRRGDPADYGRIELPEERPALPGQ